MLSRLKFDIKPLVNEMLDRLPADVWTRNDTTFLDPAMAGGQFIVEIIARLTAAGHSEDNIASRVFGLADSPLSLMFTQNKYKIRGQFSVGGIETLEKWVAEGKKFDVVIGNPPYSRNNTGKGGDASLYQDFSIKAAELSNDVVAFVTPGTFKRQTKFSSLRDIMNARGVLDIVSVPHNTFPNASVDDPSYWIIGGNGSSTVEAFVQDVYDDILAKLHIGPFMKWVGGQSPVCNATHADKLNIEQGGVFVYPYVDRVKVTGPVIVWSTSKLKKPISSTGFMVIPQRSGDTPTVHFISYEASCSQNVLSSPVSQAEYEMFKTNLSTRVLRVLLRQSARVLRGSRNIKNQPYAHTSGSLSSIPTIFIQRVWTDAELYAHFNLTQEEIDLIEATVK